MFNLSLHKNGKKKKKKSKWLCHGNLQELYTFKVPRKAPQPKSHVSSVVLAESKQDRGKCTQEDLYPIKQECKGGKPDPWPSRNKGADVLLKGRAEPAWALVCFPRVGNVAAVLCSENDPRELLLCRKHLTKSLHAQLTAKQCQNDKTPQPHPAGKLPPPACAALEPCRRQQRDGNRLTGLAKKSPFSFFLLLESVTGEDRFPHNLLQLPSFYERPE